MTLDEYQADALRTDTCAHLAPTYHGLGLAGEAGEVADKLKKLYRDDAGELTAERRHALLLELGDVLWYVATLARHLGCDLSAVAELNTEKLASRYARDALNGDGDYR